MEEDGSVVGTEEPLNGNVQDLGINRQLIIRNKPCAKLDAADAVPFDDDSFQLHLGC